MQETIDGPKIRTEVVGNIRVGLTSLHLGTTRQRTKDDYNQKRGRGDQRFTEKWGGEKGISFRIWNGSETGSLQDEK